MGRDARQADPTLPLQRRQMPASQEGGGRRPDSPDESSAPRASSPSARQRRQASTIFLGEQLGEMPLGSPGVVVMGQMKSLPQLDTSHKQRGATATGIRREAGS